jgi:hypothetical protein
MAVDSPPARAYKPTTERGGAGTCGSVASFVSHKFLTSEIAAATDENRLNVRVAGEGRSPAMELWRTSSTNGLTFSTENVFALF